MKIELVNRPLFENLIFIKFENEYIDIHNDYDFVDMEFNKISQELYLRFCCIDKPTKKFYFLFNSVVISTFRLSQFTIFDNVIIDSLYRGRGEKDGILYEKNEEGLYVFYIDFIDGMNLEFHALTGFGILEENL